MTDPPGSVELSTTGQNAKYYLLAIPWDSVRSVVNHVPAIGCRQATSVVRHWPLARGNFPVKRTVRFVTQPRIRELRGVKAELNCIISITIAGFAVAGRTPCQVYLASCDTRELVRRNWIIFLGRHLLEPSIPFQRQRFALRQGQVPRKTPTRHKEKDGMAKCHSWIGSGTGKS